jgi:hypothetical protein
MLSAEQQGKKSCRVCPRGLCSPALNFWNELTDFFQSTLTISWRLKPNPCHHGAGLLTEGAREESDSREWLNAHSRPTCSNMNKQLWVKRNVTKGFVQLKPFLQSQQSGKFCVLLMSLGTVSPRLRVVVTWRGTGSEGPTSLPAHQHSVGGNRKHLSEINDLWYCAMEIKQDELAVTTVTWYCHKVI